MGGNENTHGQWFPEKVEKLFMILFYPILVTRFLSDPRHNYHFLG